ncbi:MAG: hypothetical protein FWE32_05905 [Oscillospiraceae bacterium]|nr:hypothetical protein [Oscillospiraceae bacterium]
MKKTVLGQLFNGEIYPHEQTRPKDERYQEVAIKIGEATRSLCNTFTPEQQVLFDQLKDHCLIVAGMEHGAVFEEGFRLGARIAIEVLI